VDDHRIGRSLRALRLRAGLRQADVAKRAGVSQSLISAIEAGWCSTVTVATLRRVFQAVGAGFDGQVMWRGPALDRLVDARHAALVDSAASRLSRFGWEVLPEVSYSEFGERGSIDILGWRLEERAVVVEEVKSDVTRMEETLRKLDEKVRLVGEKLALDRLGWRPRIVGRVLVLPDTDRARRQVRSHAVVFDAALPARGPAVRAWLRRPVGSIAGVLFVADIAADGTNAARPGTQRVRVAARRGIRREDRCR
jgi:transcriptional regulator with XRE-family HTH domain